GRPDQYALAVVVYACLTGKLPYEQRSAAELATAHREAPFPSVGPGLPKGVDAVLARAAAKRREDRYPDVLAFAAALRAASGLAGDDEVPRLPPQALVTTATLPAPIAD